MKILDKQLTIGGYELEQIVRKDTKAIYSKKRPNSAILCYEVIQIKSHNGYEIAGNKYPPAEFYPKSEDWGTSAFTEKTLDKAQARLEKL